MRSDGISHGPATSDQPGPDGVAETPGFHLLEKPVVYAIVAADFHAPQALATVREGEGLTVVVLQEEADDDGLAYEFVGAWITITEQTRLDAIGITARFSAALTAADIPANVVAGFHHDHVVVPWDQRHRALEVLGAIA